MKRKIKKAWGLFKDSFKHTKNFGIKYGLSFFWHSFISRNKMYKTRLMGINICDKKFKYIYDELKDYTSNDISVDESQKTIYFFWAQGIDKLPRLQQIALDHLKKYYSDYNIVVLDLDNYLNYVKIEQHLIDKFKQGKITIQTYSDIIRFNLLYQNGGVWCDSTIINFGRLPLFEYIKEYGFWSINMDSKVKENTWGKVYPVTYTTFFIASKKGNGNMKACVNFYNDYYKKYDLAIDYFMNDYMLILCMKYKLENDQLAKIKKINTNTFLLSDYMDGKQIDFNDLPKCPQKLNWRTCNIDKLEECLKIIENK